MSAAIGELRQIPVARVHRKHDQPRQHFDEESLKQLAESIDHDGQAVPAIVRPHPKKRGHFELVSGERRWRAISNHCTSVNLLLAVIVDVDDSETLRRSFVENENRRDLHPLEKAQAMKALLEDGASKSDIARMVGRSPTYVANMLALLDLRPVVQAMLSPEIPEARRLSVSAASAIARLPGDEQIKAADFAMQRGIKVAEVVERVGDILGRNEETPKKPGFTRNHRPRLERCVKALQRTVAARFSTPEDIRSVFVTHGHVTTAEISEIRDAIVGLADDLEVLAAELDRIMDQRIGRTAA